jgi:proteasome assembly chaperone (PAC2) family protein
VFINEEKLVELPKIEIYHAKHNNRDYLIMIGDVQPADETQSYVFSGAMVEIARKFGVKEIITLGGINARTSTETPVYAACTHKDYIPALKKIGVRFDRKGTVIIVGAAGLMLGLCRLKGIKGFVLLAETNESKEGIGITAAKAILDIIMKYFKFKFPLKDLNAEIKYLGGGSRKDSKMRKKLMQRLHIPTQPSDLYYIG